MNSSTKERFMYILGGVVCLGEIVLIGLMLYIWRFGASTVDDGVVNLVYGMSLGYHSGFMLVLGYFFGSSKSSSDKTDIMAKMATETAVTVQKNVEEAKPQG